MSTTDPKTVAALALALSLTGSAAADELFAVRADANELHRVDTQTGVSALVGPFTLGGTDLGVYSIATATDGSVFGISSSPFQGAVYSFDKQTGAATFAKKFPNPVTTAGAAIDPTDGTFWFLNTYGFVPWPQLNRIDLATGDVDVPGLIGPNVSDLYAGIAFDAAGQLYVLNGTTNSLWRVDKNDPDGVNTTQVGVAFGGGIDFSQGGSLSFDPVSLQMVAYEFAKVRHLYAARLHIPDKTSASPRSKRLRTAGPSWSAVR